MCLLYDASDDTWRVSEARGGGSQPSVVQLSDGTLLAYLRSRPRVMEMRSGDGGLTWSEPTETPLRCPGSSVALRRLASGAFVVVHNDSETSRTPLSIRLSDDEGKTWAEPLALETNPGEYSYPYAIQTADGLIHVSYTFRRYAVKHVEFNETWLRRMDRPN